MINSGDTAWVLVSAGLVLFMVPGLALFYGGMVSSRNVLVMLKQNMFPLGLLSVLWILIGYTLAFGTDAGGGVIGNLDLIGLRNLDEAPSANLHVVVPGVAIPTLAFVVYMMMFAIITPALVTGATADRLKFAGYAVVIGVWSVIVYAPVAHWLWSPSGWLTTRGAQDWAGGLVVHASAGAAVLALLLVIGRRRNWPNAATRPHAIPLVVLGAGILWFGWFGFNAADGLQANGIAAQALINTQAAAAAAMLAWLLMDRFTDGRVSVLGAVTGAVAGLATITPCAGYVDTSSALIIGALAGLICHLALRLKVFMRLDDALDVIAVHFMGGILGTFLLGFFGNASINSIGADGLFYGGGGDLLGNQVLAIVVVVVFSFSVTWLIAIAVEKTIGLRVSPEDEDDLDQLQEGMSAYAFGRAAGVTQSAGVTKRPALPLPTSADAGKMRLVRALVDHEDANDIRTVLVEAGAVSIVLSEASLYTATARTEVVRGQRRMVDFETRLRLEVIVGESNVQSVVRAIQQMPGASTYAQVIDAQLTESETAGVIDWTRVGSDANSVTRGLARCAGAPSPVHDTTVRITSVVTPLLPHTPQA